MKYLLVFPMLFASLSCGCSTISRSVSAAPSQPVIVAFGDSFTVGLGVRSGENYPSKLQAKIDVHGYRYEVINSGVSGETSGQGLRRVEAICALRPKIVIVEFGVNDVLHGYAAETTRRNIAEIVTRLHKAGADVLVAKMGSLADRAPNTGSPGIPFLRGVEGNAALTQQDGSHPNAEGYDVIAENVWSVLQPLL